jgi:hypothetical protein
VYADGNNFFTFLFITILTIMKKTFYTAPELEVISTVVESGFQVSGFSTIEQASEVDYDEF